MGRTEDDQRSAEAIYALLTALLRRAPRDMSLTSLSTLSTLGRTGPRRLTDLAAVEGIAQPSMTALVGNLERDGLVERRRDPNDGRVALVGITDKGLAYMQARRRAGAESLAELVAKLPDADSSALAGTVDALLRLRRLDDEERDPRSDG